MDRLQRRIAGHVRFKLEFKNKIVILSESNSRAAGNQGNLLLIFSLLRSELSRNIF